MTPKVCVDCGAPRKPRYRRCKTCNCARNSVRSGELRRETKLKMATRPRPEVCECCGGPPFGRHTVLCYDHNHETNGFRGWLCGLCNSALGYLGDNPALADRLARYLRTHGFAVTRPVIR